MFFHKIALSHFFNFFPTDSDKISNYLQNASGCQENIETLISIIVSPMSLRDMQQ